MIPINCLLYYGPLFLHAQGIKQSVLSVVSTKIARSPYIGVWSSSFLSPNCKTVKNQLSFTSNGLTQPSRACVLVHLIGHAYQPHPFLLHKHVLCTQHIGHAYQPHPFLLRKHALCTQCIINVTKICCLWPKFLVISWISEGTERDHLKFVSNKSLNLKE